MKRVLVTRQVFPEIVASLRQRFDVDHNESDRPYTPAEMAGRVAGAHGVLSTVMDRLGEDILSAGPNLEVVSNIAVG